MIMEVNEMIYRQVDKESPVEPEDSAFDQIALQLKESNNKCDDFEEVLAEVPENYDCRWWSWNTLIASCIEVFIDFQINGILCNVFPEDHDEQDSEELSSLTHYNVFENIDAETPDNDDCEHTIEVKATSKEFNWKEDDLSSIEDEKFMNDELYDVVHRAKLLCCSVKLNRLYRDAITGVMVDHIITKISDLVNSACFSRKTNRVNFYSLMPLLFVLLFSMAGPTESVSLSTSRTHYYAEESPSFLCTVQASPIHWNVNGSNIPPEILSFIKIINFPSASALEWRSINEIYNNSFITCGVYINGTLSWSNEIVIAVQGTLDPVTNIDTVISNNEKVTIKWDAPFSLNIPTTDPDIWYDLHIYNSSASGSMPVYSKLNISTTNHTCESYPELLACATYEVMVFANNQVGSSHKASRKVSYEELKVIQVKVMGGLNITTNKLIEVTLKQTICPHNVTVIVNQQRPEIIDSSNPRVLKFQLKDNKHYENVTIRTPTEEGFTNTAVNAISTYDVNSTSASPRTNALIVSSTFVERSEARGVLYILVNVEFPMERSLYWLISKENAENGTNVHNILPGKYDLFAYDVESDGYIQSGLPATEVNVTVAGTNITAFNMDYKLCTNHSDFTSVNITCECNGFILLILQRYGDNDIIKHVTSKRDLCNGSVQFNTKFSEVYKVIVFLENEDNFGGKIIFSLLINNTFSTYIPTTDQEENKPPKSSVIIIIFFVFLGMIIIALAVLFYTVKVLRYYECLTRKFKPKKRILKYESAGKTTLNSEPISKNHCDTCSTEFPQPHESVTPITTDSTPTSKRHQQPVYIKPSSLCRAASALELENTQACATSLCVGPGTTVKLSSKSTEYSKPTKFCRASSAYLFPEDYSNDVRKNSCNIALFRSVPTVGDEEYSVKQDKNENVSKQETAVLSSEQKESDPFRDTISLYDDDNVKDQVYIFTNMHHVGFIPTQMYHIRKRQNFQFV